MHRRITVRSYGAEPRAGGPVLPLPVRRLRAAASRPVRNNPDLYYRTNLLLAPSRLVDLGRVDDPEQVLQPALSAVLAAVTGPLDIEEQVPRGRFRLADGGVSWATVSNMPLAQIEAYKARMGWTMPFVSSHGTTFADDCGAGGGFMLSVFLRDGEDVYRTYSTTARGVDRLLFVNNILDLTPYGRQEDWEDSPPGWPQHPTYG